MHRLAILLPLYLLACKGDEVERPDAVCNDATGYDGDKAFNERTDLWGLEGVTGTRFGAADLDGDGWPDLVVSEGSNYGRDDFTDDEAQRYHWVLMNRDDGDGGRVFVDETAESGLFATRDEATDEVGRAGMVHVFADVDGDGDVDVFSGQFYDANNTDLDPGDRSELMLNNGDGTFELADEQPFFIDDGYTTSGASFTDVDGDGDVDLWMVGWYEQYGQAYGEQDHLYLNDGHGDFEDVTEDAGLEMKRSGSTTDLLDGTARRPAFGATACDLDGDALPDLLASNYGRSWNQQWMNQGDGTFIDEGPESGFAGDDDLTYDQDQFYACYCATRDCDPDPGTPKVSCGDWGSYWNAGYDDQPARLNGNTFSTTCGDIDNDGDMDLMSAEIRHWHIGDGSDESELLLNDGDGSFSRPGNDSNGLARVWEQADWNQGDLFDAFFDLDNDGWKDVVLMTTDYPYDRIFLFRQVAEGQFEEIGEDAELAQEWPAGLAIADFDRDGDLDVVTGSSTARSGTPWDDHEVHFYESKLGGGNWSRISLRSDRSNSLGIGARVEVQSGSLSQVQEVSGGYGHVGMQHDIPLSFGFDDSCEDLEITVTWPGGSVDTYIGVRANYAVTLVEGGEVVYAE